MDYFLLREENKL